MKQDGQGANKYSRRRRRAKGAQIVEFTLNFLPFMAMVIVVVDTAWAVFAEATLQQSVRMAARVGVTLTNTQINGDLTSAVKALVQQHSVGLLNGATGLSYIKVNYFDGNNPSTDVSTQSWGNISGNIMQVSVQNFPLVPLMARIFTLKDSPDRNALSISVYSADVIEPMSTSLTPPIGAAP